MREIYIITGNHTGGHLHISDIVKLIISTLRNAFPDIIVHVKNAPVCNKINIIIEEMYDNAYCQGLLSFKSFYPRTRFILFLTEFPINKTFNEFEILSSLKNKILSLSNFEFLSTKHLVVQKPIVKQRLFQKINKLIFFKKDISNKFIYHSRFFGSETYFKLRFLNTQYLTQKLIFDHVLYFHSAMKKDIENFFPEASYFPFIISQKPFFSLKPFFGFFSGSLTPARNKILKSLKSENKSIIVASFDDLSREVYSSQSFYNIGLPRYKNWSVTSISRNLSGLWFNSYPLQFGEFDEDSIERDIKMRHISHLVFNERDYNAAQDEVLKLNGQMNDIINARNSISRQILHSLFMPLFEFK